MYTVARDDYTEAQQPRNNAIVAYTSSALCTPVTPFPADPIFSERGSDGMIPSVTLLAIE